jgi:SM-20-related protein
MRLSYRLNPRLDLAELSDAYRRTGRVRINEFLLEEDAAALRSHLAAREDWRQVVNSGDKVFELDRATRAAMTEEQRASLDDAVAAGARDGFQYRFESIRVPDGRVARAAVGADPVGSFAIWLSNNPALALLRAVTGASDAQFVDAQATAYAPGDLLTAHDDNVAGKQRRAAYVFGLSPGWRPEWGGLLLFHGAQATIEGEAPGFNTFDLFAVPQAHSVSQVTAAAPYRRYSVTGWLRAQPQPD